jgi:DNA polymerase-3 subunit delta'
MGVDQTRGLVGRIGVMPTRSDWNVVVIEDADRLNEHADNALLKSLEEPPPHGVWVLCAPSLDDVLPTIRSRCRVVRLRTPPIGQVADFLERVEGIDRPMAAYAARAAQGHIGRARALATDSEVRLRHQRVIAFPQRLGSVSQCMAAAAEVIDDAREQVAEHSEPREAEEVAELLRAYGEGGTGAGSARARASSVLKDLEKEQRNRRRRFLRDELDRVLLDLLGLYRDVLVALCGADVDLVNPAAAVEIERLVARGNAATAMSHLDAILHAREALAADGAEELVFATLALQLGRGATVPVRSGNVASERVP